MSMRPPFAYPYMCWIGMNAQEDGESLAEFHHFYTRTHLPEVLASNAGFERGARYELLGSDPHGACGPSSLAIYEMASEAAMRAYIARNRELSDAQPRYMPGPPVFQSASRDWTMLWRRLMSNGDWRALPHAIYTIGVNILPDGGGADFSSFYANAHMPSAVSQNGFTRGTCFELYRGSGDTSAPEHRTFCSVYELDEPTTRALLARGLTQISVSPLVKDRTSSPLGGIL